jgi:ammonia channel protein AmtB
VGAWSFVWSLFYFGTTKYFGVLRISPDEERYGLDVTNHMRMTKMQRSAFKGGSGKASSSNSYTSQ